MLDHRITIDHIKANAEKSTAYIETARNAIEKLHDEYFFNVPAKYDPDLFSAHLDKIISQYDYITFMIGILDDAMKHIDFETKAISAKCMD